MRVVTQLPQDDLRKVQIYARRIEATGVDGVIAMENKHTPFLALLAAALATERVQLATAVALAFPRSPAITASTAWDIHVASGGRLYLGLGTQVKGHIERRFGMKWTPPEQRMRDYLGATRALWRCWEKQERLNYVSENYKLTLMTPNFMPDPTGLPLPPLATGAVGPAMLRLAGETCDGVRLHPYVTRKYLHEVIDAQVAEGRSRGGCARANFDIAAGGFVATGADEEAVRNRREFIRYRVAFYGSTKAYWPVLQTHGLMELGEKLRQYAAAGRWSEMAALIPDDVLDLFAVCGTFDAIAEQLEERYGGVVDTIELPMPTDIDIDNGKFARAVEQIQRIPIKFQGHRDGLAWTRPPEAAG